VQVQKWEIQGVGLIFERIKSAGLAHNSYFVGSGSAAAVIDPRRDGEVYLDLARQYGMRIKAIFETHRHEDFVSGAQDLAEAAQAPVFHGPRPDWQYGSVLKDGQVFNFGKINLTTLFTPGHTDESVSFILTDPASGPHPVLVFTGDALFIGDTGRIDLYGPAEKPRLAANLYESLWQKILPQGDGVILCPAHGSGSVCGINIADRDESSLGIEKRQNPSLQFKDPADFIRHKSNERPERPLYFRKMESYNLNGPPRLRVLPAPPPLPAGDFQSEIVKGAAVIDTRWPAAFGGAHIQGSYSIWLEGLSSFAGWILPYDQQILLVLENADQTDAAVRHLIRLGYDRITGFLKDGIEGWYNSGLPIESLPLLSVQQLKEKLDRKEDMTVLDVRDELEWSAGHLAGAQHIYVGQVAGRLAEIPRTRPVAAMCSVGHRAGLAASILQRAGYPQVYNVPGSYTAWRRAGYPVTKS
jgi:hydroxyacylglutathione hydrolase